MCASRARDELCLTEADLAGLKMEHAPNPHGRGHAPMRLYDQGELQAAALAKLGSAEGLAKRMATKAGGSVKQRAFVAAGGQPKPRGGGGGGFGRARWEDDEEEDQCPRCDEAADEGCRHRHCSGCCPGHCRFHGF
jgi:hypothetical protein